jgi:predicted ABC-type transport system involved in lysophospholipase L1 biosynthesis ATPase subunit
VVITHDQQLAAGFGRREEVLDGQLMSAAVLA